jgi:hypothetical protein
MTLSKSHEKLSALKFLTSIRSNVTIHVRHVRIYD